MDFSVEEYAGLTGEIDRLCAEAVDEVVVGCKFNYEIDHSQFINMDSIGLLRLITARSNGKLVGFHVSTITDDIFYKGKKTAFVLFYLLDKNFRGKGQGIKMFDYAEKLNIENDVDRCFMSRKVHLDNEKMFLSLGYINIEANYEKYYE